MKRKSFLAAAAFGLAIILSSCGKGVSVSTEEYAHTHILPNGVVTTGYEDVHADPSTLRFQGTHDFSYTPTSYPLLKRGVTPYTIVIPDNAPTEVFAARDELIHFFYQATGVTLSARLDKGLTFSETAEYISLGDTSLYATSGLSIDKESLTRDGAAIRTVGHSIFCYGGSASGVLFAVYDLLKLYFHFEAYSPDVYEIDRNVTNLSLWDFAVTDIPDIKDRSKNYGFMKPDSGNYDQLNYGRRLRMIKERVQDALPIYREWDCQGSSARSTNTNTYVPYDLWSGEHPDWFSDRCETGKYQLCYTAHGNHEEYEGLVNHVVRKITDTLIGHPVADYPDSNLVTFTMEDNFNICDCEECTKTAAKYGAEIAPVVLFTNEVGKRIDAWMNLPENEAYRRPSFKIIYFAYNQYTDAPVKRSGDGFEPTYPEVKLYKNTGVYLAIMDRFDYQFDAFDNPIRSGGVTGDFTGIDTINSWSALTDSIYLWLYQTNFSQYGYFYDSFSFFNQPFYNYLASRDLKMFFAQGQDTLASGNMGTNWNNLKVYLNAKLSWDSSLDESTLIDRYFVAMYGKSAPAMRALFAAVRAHYAHILESNPSFVSARSIYNKIASKTYFPLGTLEGLRAMGDAALSAIVDGDYPAGEAENIRRNIEAEIFPFLFMEISLYDMELYPETKHALASRMLADIEWLRLEGMMSRENNGTSMKEIALGALL